MILPAERQRAFTLIEPLAVPGISDGTIVAMAGKSLAAAPLPAKDYLLAEVD